MHKRYLTLKKLKMTTLQTFLPMPIFFSSGGSGETDPNIIVAVLIFINVAVVTIYIIRSIVFLIRGWAPYDDSLIRYVAWDSDMGLGFFATLIVAIVDGLAISIGITYLIYLML